MSSQACRLLKIINYKTFKPGTFYKGDFSTKMGIFGALSFLREQIFMQSISSKYYLILSSTLILTWLFSSQNACIAVDFLKITVMELAADIVVSNTIMIKKIWNVTPLIIMDAKEITIILIRTTNVPYSVEAIIGNILAHIVLLGPGFRKLLSEIWKFLVLPNYLWSHTERNDFWIS